jgi:peptidyl-prolyl cis-trans isomerase A (cyclophilin A)
MRSLIVASCLTALLCAPQGFAAEPAAKAADTAKAFETKSAETKADASVAKVADGTAAPVKTPEASAPATKASDAKAVEAKAADIKAPEAKSAEAKPAEVKAPDTAAKPADAPKADENKGGTVVEIKTTEGNIKLELADREAPVTVKNFLAYVNDKFYDGTLFHRVIDNFVIQGGGYVVEGEKFVEKPTKAPIINEAKNGLKNVRGSIAMARTKDPNSATSQFYINQVSNELLDYPGFDGHGYTVFGKVIDGIDVVDKIAKVKTGVRGGMGDVPLADVKILSVQVARPAGH